MIWLEVFMPQVSGAVGGASAVLHVETQHTHAQPFRGLVKVFGGYGEKQVGVMLRTASDDAWQSFNGSMEVSAAVKRSVR